MKFMYANGYAEANKTVSIKNVTFVIFKLSKFLFFASIVQFRNKWDYEVLLYNFSVKYNK